MKAFAELSTKDQSDVQSHTLAVDNAFGLPPGTIISVITKLLPILLQLFGSLGGTAKPPTA